MAIDITQITTEITLELDREELPVNEFAKALDSFFGLIKEITRESVPQKDSAAWLVKVYPGSAGVGLVRKPGVLTPEESSMVCGTILTGLRQLERGERHPKFTDKAVDYSRKLSNPFSSKHIPSKLRLYVQQKEPLYLTKIMAVKATELLEPNYEDDGSVEGTLEKLNAHGQLEFVIYDILDNRAIKCEVQEEQLHDAWAAWRNRVEVIGTVRYRRDGQPVSVKAKKIIPFPKREEILSLDEIRTLLGEA